MMFEKYLERFTAVLQNSNTTSKEGMLELDKAFDEVNDLFEACRNRKSTVYLLGNGGSSAIVSHAAIDFLNACGFKAQALTDNSLLTCMANDYGYENVFSQPLKTMIETDDVVVAVSSSGQSENIVNAASLAAEKGAKVITFSAFEDTNPLRKKGDYNFWLETNNYGIAEIGHSLLLHHITDRLLKK